jgi:AcrR family transcriptional regulator
MRSNNKRADILDAALKVVADKGANHLTIDAVAARAGFSKGGVLYHFSSKKELLSGMLDHLIEANHQRTAKYTASENPLSAILHVDSRMTQAEKRASMAIVAAAAENPDLLKPAREQYANMITEVSELSDDPTEAILLFLANEGLRFLDIFELNPMTTEQSNEIFEQLALRARQL